MSDPKVWLLAGAGAALAAVGVRHWWRERRGHQRFATLVDSGTSAIPPGALGRLTDEQFDALRRLLSNYAERQ